MINTNTTLAKTINSLAITKQLNFLIGSGASTPEIRLMNQIEADTESKKNQNLLEGVKTVSEAILEDRGNIQSKLQVYTRFLQAVINILNMSNSRQVPKSGNIFTTNYDLFFEMAADRVLQNNRLVFNDGANGYFNRIMDSSNFNKVVAYKGLNDNYLDELPSLNLIKPHGSVNWKRRGDDSVEITGMVQENPVVVPPTGHENATTFLDNHFHDMLRIFQLELDKRQSVLFILGFSFQDQHIAKMIRRAIQNPELMVYAFCYSKEDKRTYLTNLHFEERANFRILVPTDFEEVINQDEGSYKKPLERFNFANLVEIFETAKMGEANENSN